MNGDFLVNPVEVVRDGDTVAAGALMSSGQVVVEWNREAFPEDERTEGPTLSIYRDVDDAEEATGGTVEIGEAHRAMTDGGTSITGPGGDGPEPGTVDDGEPATDPVNPEMVAAYTPAFVVSSDAAERFVADYSVLDSGWVRVRDWDGEVQKIPPHKINAIRHVRKERYGDGGRNGYKPEQLADEDLRERAREMGGAGGDE